MKNLKKKNFKELNSSEMKQVQGGRPLLNEVLSRANLVTKRLVDDILIIL